MNDRGPAAILLRQPDEIIALGVVGYGILFDVRPGHDLLVVSAREATLHAGHDGESEFLEPGMSVDVASTVRTGVGGNVALQYGDGANLMLMSNASMKVLNADRSGVRVELQEGTLSARVRPGMPPLGITNRGRAVNATDADFTVMVDRGGGLSAMAREGSLKLQGFEGQSVLRKDEILRAIPQADAVVAAATESLLLDVQWPDAQKTRAEEMELTGRTDPYASVVFGAGQDAIRVRADRDGNFRATVPLQEGENALELTVQDVLGREAKQNHTVRRDSTAPVIQAAEVVWGP